jgi:hypothetical protein
MDKKGLAGATIWLFLKEIAAWSGLGEQAAKKK